MNTPSRTVAALALLGLCGLLPMAAFSADTAVIGAGAGAKVNVRRDPAVTGGNIVGRAIGGDRVDVLETAERGQYTWYKVQGPGGAYTGWVRGDLVETVTTAPVPAQSPASGSASAPVESASVPSSTPSPATSVPSPTPSSVPSVTASPAPSVPLPTPTPAPSAAPSTTGEASSVVAVQPDDRPPLASRDDWSRNLIEFYPAISDCLKVSSAQPAVAVKALTLNGGLVDVVVRDAAERRWECIVRVEGGTPLRYDPVTWQLALPQRNSDPVFTPLTIEPPAGECFANESVVDPASERQLGWLTYRTCP